MALASCGRLLVRSTLRCCWHSRPASGRGALLRRPDFDFDYLLNPDNRDTIQRNIENRKQVGDIAALHDVWDELKQLLVQDNKAAKLTSHQLADKWDRLYQLASELPNTSHADTPVGDESRCVQTRGQTPTDLPAQPKTAEHLSTKQLRALRTDMRAAGGHRSYVLLPQLSAIQQAIIDWAVDSVQQIQPRFQLIYVPDILDRQILAGCGLLRTRDTHGIAYRLRSHPNLCLSGTGEMGIASYLAGQQLPMSDLPLYLLTVSTCYRPEAFTSGADAGLYRVHSFQKVEMFIVTANESGAESDAALAELLDIQQALYDQLGFKYRVLDMCTSELGASAACKHDCEAWMPGREMWGEVSSASNCTDYQSQRLGITYLRDEDASLRAVHTCNATAVACPRLTVAVLENAQRHRGAFQLPDVIAERLRPDGQAPDRTLGQLSAQSTHSRTTFDWLE